MYTLYTMYYHNTCIKWTKIQAFCTLRIPFSIVFYALFNHGCLPIQPLHKMYVFINMVITRFTNASPDMILTAFDVTFHEKNDWMPPEACRPLKKLKQKQCRKSGPSKKRTHKNFEQVGPTKLKQKQCRTRGFIYDHIPSYSHTYIKIVNIRKMRANIKQKNGHNSAPDHPQVSKLD